MFIKITQDGIGRLSADSPKEIEGLYTDGLEICVAIILVGKKNISLIHDTGDLNLKGKNSVEAEVAFSEPSIAYICQNSTLPRGSDARKYQKRVVDFLKGKVSEIKVISLEKSEINKKTKANVAWVAIKRDGILLFNKLNDSQLRVAPNIDARHELNNANNFFSFPPETIPADFQYDGKIFTPSPPLIKSDEEIIKLVRGNRFDISVLLVRMTAIYVLCKYEELENSILLSVEEKGLLFNRLYTENLNDPLVLLAIDVEYSHGQHAAQIIRHPFYSGISEMLQEIAAKANHPYESDDVLSDEETYSLPVKNNSRQSHKAARESAPMPRAEKQRFCFWIYYTSNPKTKAENFINIPLCVDSAKKPMANNCFNTREEAEIKFKEIFSDPSISVKKAFIFRLKGTAAEIITKYEDRSIKTNDFVDYFLPDRNSAPAIDNSPPSLQSS